METATKEMEKRQWASVLDKMRDYSEGAMCISAGLVTFGAVSFYVVQMQLSGTSELLVSVGGLGQLFGLLMTLVGILEIGTVKRFRRIEECLNALSPQK
ncbi:MAG: hypothetical protein WC343_04580 [Bacilli bacterium]